MELRDVPLRLSEHLHATPPHPPPPHPLPLTLPQVHISIPVPAADAPTVTDGEGASFNKREGMLTWVIPVIDSANGSGSIEFTAAVDSPDAFFPIDVRFHSQKTFCDMEVPTVLSAEDGSSFPFGKVGGLSVETYRVN